jgi:hypothetical protein
MQLPTSAAHYLIGQRPLGQGGATLPPYGSSPWPSTTSVKECERRQSPPATVIHLSRGYCPRASLDAEDKHQENEVGTALASYAGKQQDWNVRLYTLHLSPQNAACRFLQVVFQENAVHTQSCQKAQCLVASRRGRDLVASFFQHVFQHAHVFRVILNAKNSGDAH